MDPTVVLQLVMQLIGLFPTLDAAFVQAMTDFQSLFANGATPSQAQIDALITRIKSQSAEIQAET